MRGLDGLDGARPDVSSFVEARAGLHSLSIADVDGNGTDEIIYGGMTINSDGTGRYTTNFHAHGDALHVSDFVPSRPGQKIWQSNEQSSGAAATLRDARTVWSHVARLGFPLQTR